MEARLHSLDEIFALAAAHDFYRERLSGIKHFSQAPITDKSLLYELVTAKLSQEGETQALYLSPTGGSIANQLLFFPTAIKENTFQRSVLAPYLNAAGMFKGAVAINLFGSNMMYRSMEIFNYFLEAADATTLPFSSGCDDAAILALSKHFRADTLMGMPSRLMQFAQHVRTETSDSDRLKLKHIVYAGESLSEQKRDYLFEIFGATKFSAIFGSAEAGIWAYRPYSLNQEGYLYPLEIMHVEVLDPDAQGFGRLVLTNLIRCRNPLLRYDCGDRGKISTINYQGKMMGLLEFSGRAANSFQIGGNYFDISELSEITAPLLDFQIELSYDRDKHKDRLLFLAVHEQADKPGAAQETDKKRPKSDEEKPDRDREGQDRDNEKQDRARESLAERLMNILQSNGDFLVSVDLVTMKDLTRSRTSGKVIKVLDKR